MIGKKADIEVVTDHGEYAFGTTVNAKIRVDVRKNANVSRGVVQLVCRQRYQYSSTSTDSQGRSTSTTSWSADERVLAEEEILGHGAIRAGDMLEQTVALRLPPHGPPTAKGSVTEVMWEVRARVEARFSRDPKEAVPIVVAAIPLDRAAWGQLPMTHPADDCDMALEIDSGSVARGDRLSGRLSVTPRDDIKARRVRIRLDRVERVHRPSGSSVSDAVVKEVVADDVGRMERGVTQRYPFQLTIPRDACPSLETETATVRWQVVGEVERRMRRDEEVTLGVHLH